MKRTTNVLCMLGVATAAFLAGQSDFFGGSQSTASAQDTGMTPKMAAALEAMEKAGTPGEGHALLEEFVGEWDARLTIRSDPNMPPMSFTGTISRKLVLGGRFMEERVNLTSSMGPLEGLGYLGYDKAEQRYVMIWMNDHATHVATEHGYYDAKAKVLRVMSAQPDTTTGRIVPTWGEMNLSSPGKQTYVGHAIGADGAKFEMFQGVFTKK